ncbi:MULTISPECIES: KGG domain-containing protein [unclassified Bosea (in: a-proteobacteria)]|uniref:general stress protein n=1 Tax=unclassified Bosea (in: a-proteobacteria) TaxID=2653178 RepID=UPI000F765597|nr:MULTISPECIES: KGG domain-containing protein [unclassified Bosea (in: a-proteobacteria)]AZO82040.1 stress-induced protein [Bosea sp. Tri-49]RXT24613.1 stress-induced protein [Bosea sp. Tri-39]RXT42448.1 stress-induced protein [Bosea sp. Tri-54]
MANDDKRGFASMDENKQRDIASKGGRSVPDEKRSFKQDREVASEAGKKGGENSSGGQQQGGDSNRGQQGGGQRGGSGNSANDRERAADAGRKGGTK